MFTNETNHKGQIFIFRVIFTETGGAFQISKAHYNELELLCYFISEKRVVSQHYCLFALLITTRSDAEFLRKAICVQVVNEYREI